MRVVDMPSRKLAAQSLKRRVEAEEWAAANREMARTLTALNRRYPHLNAASAMTLAESGHGPDSAEARLLADLQKRRDESESWWEKTKGAVEEHVETVTKPFVRTSLTALGAPYEYVQGQFRSAVSDFQRAEFASMENYRRGILGSATFLGVPGVVASGRGEQLVGQTRLGAAAQVSRETGGKVSIPEALNNLPQMGPDRDPANLLEREQQSWLPGPNSLAEKRQVSNARNAGMVNGRATTFGRAAGFLIGSEPGGAANDLVAAILSFGNTDDPYDDLDPEQMRRARQVSAATGVPVVQVEANDPKVWQERAQRLIEGSIDVGGALALDPIGRASAARARQAARKGEFGGQTVELTAPPVMTARRTDKATGKVTEVPIVVDGAPRRTVVFRNALDWLDSRKGARFLAYAAREDNYERLAAVLGRSTHPSTVLRVLDETDPKRMRDVIIEEMGRGFVSREPTLLRGDVYRAGGEVNRIAGIASATMRRPTARWRQLAPSETVVSREDPAWAVEQYRRMVHGLRTGVAKGALSDDFVAANIADFARGVVDDAADWSVPYRAVADVAKQSLLARGVRRGDAENITRIWMERVTSQRNYWVDRHSGAAKHAFVTVDGDDLPIPKASASAEMFTEGIPLIDTGQFARAASRLARLYENPGWKGLVSAGDGMTAFFKFMVLPLRGPAWMIRNLAEAQARVTVEGLDGIMDSPLAALAYRVGDNPRSRASRLLGRMDRSRGRGSVDVSGRDFRLQSELEDDASRFARAQEHKGGVWYDDGAVAYTDEYPVVHRDSGNYTQWLSGQRFTLGKLSSSEEYRIAVQADSPQAANEAFWTSRLRVRMAQREPQLATREGSDAYMDKVRERIQDVTGGNPNLMEAIAHGRIDGHPLVVRNARGNLAPNPKAEQALERYADDLPEWTVTKGSVTGRGERGMLSASAEAFERLVMRNAFALFGSAPNNRFVNSPTFRQLHWQDAVRLAPLATKQARAQMLANARKANMPTDVIRRLEADFGPPGTLDVDDIRDLADARAFERWMDIVYNSHNKGNWTRSVRMLSPFAAAVADMYRFWGKRLARNPLVLHRVEQGMHGARQSGFFYSDENGEERFAYPLTRALSSVVFGVEKGLSGTVKGANMITSSVLPGFGPVVSWPASWFTPDRPEYDALREIINPYGDPDASGGILEGFAPRHVQRALAALGAGSAEQKRAYTEALADTMAYLASTGEYGNSVKEQERLRADAAAKGKALWLVQAFAQGALPSSPRGEFYANDKDGRLIAITRMAADFRRFMREDPDTASQNLLAKYGDAAFLAVTGGTSGTGQLTTQAAHDLARENPRLTERYPLVWSFFTDPNAPYSHDEFLRQIRSGEREPRSLKERQVAAQTYLATSMYMQHKREVGPFPTGEQAAYLRYVKAEIRKEFPLWDDSFDVGEVNQRVEQTFALAKEPTFRGTPVAEAVRTYQQARREIIDYYNSAGVTSSETGWGRAKGAEDGRDYLRYLASQLSQDTPEFATLWERVFDAEMVDDVEGAP